jgi:hypothetical protein
MLPLKTTSADDFQTPPTAVEPLITYLPKHYTYWEPACGTGNIVRTLESYGYTIFGTDLLSGCDFLAGTSPAAPQAFDALITNPPYSLKDHFLARCYHLHKPFALLLPLTALEGQRRQQLFRQYGIEIVCLPHRIAFELPRGGKSASWFATAWFTHGLQIGSPLVFTA